QMLKGLNLLQNAVMRVMKTGTTGLIVLALTKVLHARGIVVTYLITSGDKMVSIDEFQCIHWNPSQVEIDLECFRDVQAVINLAGANIGKPWTPMQRKKILRSRIDSLATLKKGLGQVGASQVECLVSASAIGIYPDSHSKFYEEDEKEISGGFWGDVS